MVISDHDTQSAQISQKQDECTSCAQARELAQSHCGDNVNIWYNGYLYRYRRFLSTCAENLSPGFCQFAEMFKWLFKISSTWLGPIKWRIGCESYAPNLVPLQWIECFHKFLIRKIRQWKQLQKIYFFVGLHKVLPLKLESCLWM